VEEGPLRAGPMQQQEQQQQEQQQQEQQRKRSLRVHRLRRALMALQLQPSPQDSRPGGPPSKALWSRLDSRCCCWLGLPFASSSKSQEAQ
jgi:hypothetical protein